MAPFNRSIMNSYWCSIVTIALSCIISEIKRDVGRKSRFFSSDAPVRVPIRTLPWRLAWKTIMVVIPGAEEVWYVQHFQYNTGVWKDRQTDRQTFCNSIVRAMHTRRAIKSLEVIKVVVQFSWAVLGKDLPGYIEHGLGSAWRSYLARKLILILPSHGG